MQGNNFQEMVINRIEEFIMLNRTTPDKLQIEAKSAELTKLSKDPAFVNVVHHLIINEQSLTHDRKDKVILMTSLLKDKFKF